MRNCYVTMFLAMTFFMAKQDPQKVQIDINPETTPILYTDNIMIRASKNGLILEVCQAMGPKRLKVVSRIGMSIEHGQKFVQELGKTVAMTATTEKN